MLEIDGSMGEGGGQVLRTSLALAILTQTPVRLYNIRAGRSKPGLQPQHLQSVRAAAAICGGQARGDALQSRELLFEPGDIHAGRYSFDIGTAGSAPLVLQTVFLPLATGKESSTLAIAGGTHVPHSPSYHYLERQWLPVMRELGFWGKLEMERAGFYPIGGGVIHAMLRPVSEIKPFERVARGELTRIRGVSAVANLENDIARRQKLQALRVLQPVCADTKIETVEIPSPGKGTMLFLQAEFESPAFPRSSASSFALGAQGKRAEAVADEASAQMLAFLSSGAAVDEHLADQLVLPLCFASGPSRYTTARVTLHLLTQAALVALFLPAWVTIDGEEGQPGTVMIQPEH